jgi:hypothetical protein
MKRFVALFAMLAGVLVPLGVTTTPAAQAYCPPPDGSTRTIYKFRNADYRYHPTNIKSDWVIFPHGGTISYSRTKTMEVNASVTATVQAEAGVIFAKASTSLSVSVGGSYSQSQQWTYSANVPADRDHKRRLHSYHYTVSFSVMKKNWSPGDCRYKNAWGRWQRIKHAPAKADRNVWRVDKAPA